MTSTLKRALLENTETLTNIRAKPWTHRELSPPGPAAGNQSEEHATQYRWRRAKKLVSDRLKHYDILGVTRIIPIVKLYCNIFTFWYYFTME